MLMWLLHHFLISRWKIFLPSFYTYREKENEVINFYYSMHGHQILETILVSDIFQSKLKYI